MHMKSSMAGEINMRNFKAAILNCKLYSYNILVRIHTLIKSVSFSLHTSKLSTQCLGEKWDISATQFQVNGVILKTVCTNRYGNDFDQVLRCIAAV